MPVNACSFCNENHNQAEIALMAAMLRSRHLNHLG